MELSTLREAVKPLPIPLAGGTLNITYYPGRYTRQMSREVDAREKAHAQKVKAAEAAGEEKPEEEAGPIADILATLLASWDLVDQGQPIPITADTLVDQVGYLYMVAIFRAILEDITVGASSGPNTVKR